MDHTRNAFLAGLALVSYLMLLAWNEDYPQQAPQNAEISSVPVQNTLDLPQAVNSTQVEDLPQIQNASGSSVAQTISTNNALISISTPVHQVNIDLLGG